VAASESAPAPPGKDKAMTVPTRRSIGVLLATALAAVFAFTPASPAAAAATCYNHTGNVSSQYLRTDGLDKRVPIVGNFTTTSYCRDINLYIDADTISPDYPYLVACVVFIRHTTECSNYWVPAGPGWTVIATDVKDDSAFIVKIAAMYGDSDAYGTWFKLAF
jgi:hypothetical protein